MCSAAPSLRALLFPLYAIEQSTARARLPLVFCSCFSLVFFLSILRVRGGRVNAYSGTLGLASTLFAFLRARIRCFDVGSWLVARRPLYTVVSRVRNEAQKKGNVFLVFTSFFRAVSLALL